MRMEVFEMTAFGFISAMLRPDFMQAMVLCTGVFLLPLEHRSVWKIRYAIILAASFPAGGFLQICYDNLEDKAFLPEIWPALLFQIIYFCAPLLASYFSFRVCTRISRADAVYGAACVYAVQHTEFCLSIILFRIHTENQTVVSWLLLSVIMILAWFFPARQLQKDGYYSVSRGKAATMAGIMAVIGLVLNCPFRFLPGLRDSFAYPLSLAYDLCCCLFLIWLQMEQQRELRMASSAAAERQLRIQMENQYRLSRENIGIINRKCHDLKKQLGALRRAATSQQSEEKLRELEKSILIYDMKVNTGNKALDTVLTEKSLLCEKNNISWTCMADGSILNTVSPVDLYTLFDIALDHAAETSKKLPDAAERNVSVVVRKCRGGALIMVENYISVPSGEKAASPEQDKKEKMKFDPRLDSIHRIAKRYGGTAGFSVHDHVFTLSIFLPLSA